jgi:ABC-type Fe3+/spermidine/putrescine transport system ATPase subunit
MSLDVRGVVVDYGTRRVLDAVDLGVEDGEIVCVVGPSGCGKSTLLRVIAGLLVPARGTVAIDGIDVTTVPPHRRRVGLVFQDDVLFPHLDVRGNIAYGLRAAGTPRAAIAPRVGELLDLVGLTGFERRDVATLSGGEAQRVAVARALAPRPRVLLLDEPFGALDPELRDRLVVDVRRMMTAVSTTAVHVTHDRAEAAAMGDRVVTLG